MWGFSGTRFRRDTFPKKGDFIDSYALCPPIPHSNHSKEYTFLRKGGFSLEFTLLTVVGVVAVVLVFY